MFALIPKHLRNPYRNGRSPAPRHWQPPEDHAPRHIRSRDRSDLRRWMRDAGIL